MAGLAEAAGAYVWFADPDDLLADGALAMVAQRLRYDRPDVLLIDYLIMTGPGRTEPSPGAALLAAPAGGARTLALAERPALLERTMTVWSKVISRPFLAGLGVAFPPGIHEDVAVSCAVLLCARRIALLDRVCYLYRRRPGSFLATASMAHFAIFPAYERAFALAGMPGPRPRAAPAVQAALFGRALEHYTALLANGLIPAGARRDFFARMAGHARRYRPAGYRRPRGVRGVKVLAVERDAYRAYRLLAGLNGLRVAARRALRRR
jgi:CDP-glycerol glycerophosphotransferase